MAVERQLVEEAAYSLPQSEPPFAPENFPGTESSIPQEAEPMDPLKEAVQRYKDTFWEMRLRTGGTVLLDEHPPALPEDSTIGDYLAQHLGDDFTITSMAFREQKAVFTVMADQPYSRFSEATRKLDYEGPIESTVYFGLDYGVYYKGIETPSLKTWENTIVRVPSINGKSSLRHYMPHPEGAIIFTERQFPDDVPISPEAISELASLLSTVELSPTSLTFRKGT